MEKTAWKLLMNAVRDRALELGGKYRSRFTDSRIATRTTKFWRVSNLEAWMAAGREFGLEGEVTTFWGSVTGIRFSVPRHD